MESLLLRFSESKQPAPRPSCKQRRVFTFGLPSGRIQDIRPRVAPSLQAHRERERKKWKSHKRWQLMSQRHKSLSAEWRLPEAWRRFPQLLCLPSPKCRRHLQPVPFLRSGKNLLDGLSKIKTLDSFERSSRRRLMFSCVESEAVFVCRFQTLFLPSGKKNKKQPVAVFLCFVQGELAPAASLLMPQCFEEVSVSVEETRKIWGSMLLSW